jgi:Flp pilus assembly protein TadD
MDNERLEELTTEFDEEQVAGAPLHPVEVDRKSVGLIWRLAALALALVIIAVLGYPLLQKQLAGATDSNPAPAADTQSVVATPAVEAPADPNSAEGWFELGKAHYKANQYAQAAAAFQKAVELDPTYQAAYANLGATYHRQNRLDLAAAQYEKALELKPDDGEVVYNLAAVYLQQATRGGQPDPKLLQKAIDQLNRARELSPNAAEPYFGLGVAYMLLNQRDQAAQSFETFLTRDSGQDPRASQEAQNYLKMLRGQ